MVCHYRKNGYCNANNGLFIMLIKLILFISVATFSPMNTDYIDPPPHDFDNVELATWNAVISELIESRVLGRQDLRALESYCISYALMKEARFHIQEDGITIVQANGNTVKNPATTVLNEAITRLNSIGGEFGLTPVSRSRVNVPKTKAKGNRFLEDL